MKHPSQKTSALIRQLYATRSFREKLIGRQDAMLEVFEEIAASDEALAIPHLTSFLHNERSDVREAAALAIDRLLADVPSPS